MALTVIFVIGVPIGVLNVVCVICGFGVVVGDRGWLVGCQIGCANGGFGL